MSINISFGSQSQDLLGGTQENIDWVEKWISLTDYVPWCYPSWPGKNILSLTYPEFYYPPKKVCLNSYTWYSGAMRWSYGFFLASANEATAIQAMAFTAGTSNLLTLTLTSKETVTIKCYCLSIKPLSGIRNVNGYYLLTLVGPSYYWWFKPLTALPTIPTPNNNTVTWQQLYNQVATILGITFTNDIISANYLYPNNYLNLNYELVPPYFDAIASNVGQRIIVGLNGTVKGQNYASALALQLAEPARTVKAGGQALVGVL